MIIMQHSIVIVDDDDDLRKILKESFTNAGYKVYLAENGLRLIALLQSEEIHAVLLDINMPWLSGYQICKSIKSDKKLNNLKVIYMSAVITDENECYKTGCDGIIKKPFVIQEVLEKINLLLDR